MRDIINVIPAKLKAAVALLLTIGLGSATGIYVRSANLASDSTAYDPENSKQYLREMEVYGGKANLIAGDFRQWFATLWHGRSLAVTIAVLTVLVSLALLFFGTPLPPGPDSDH